MENQNPRRQRHHRAHDVLDQQDGKAALLVDAGENLHHAVGFGRPQPRHHLVEQQELRIGGERARHFEALPVGQRQRRGGLAALVVEIEPGEHLAGMGARRRDVLPAMQRADHDVVLDGEPRERPHQLERAADAAPAHHVGREPVDPLAGERDVAAIRREHAGDHVEQRGLACAVRPDHRENHALRHRERHIGHRAQPAEVLGHVGDLEQRGHLSAPPCLCDRR